MTDTLNAFTSLVRKGVDEYNMISAGDRIAVGVSGGKDSLMLLRALRHLQSYYPAPFTLRAITIDLGFAGMDFGPVAAMCADIGVPYERIPTDIRQVVFDLRQEENPCSLCAKMRRGALNNALKAAGCNKLALGHHRDDAVETFTMSLLLEGRISCFKPVTYMSRMDVWQIRPMVYVDEWRVTGAAKALALPVVENPCPEDRTSSRHDVKELLRELNHSYPDIKNRIFGAMQRLPLDGWAPTPMEGRKK